MLEKFTKWDHYFYFLVFLTLIVLTLGSFLSISFLGLSHLLVIPAFIYFYYFGYQEINRKLRWSTFFLFLLVFILVVSILVNYSDYQFPGPKFGKIKYFIAALLGITPFYFFIKNKLSEKKVKILFYLLMFSSCLAHLMGIIGLYSGYNLLKGESVHAMRSSGMFGNVMTYGYQTSWLVILIAGIYLFSPKIKKVLPRFVWLLWFAVSALGLYYSYTRGAMFGTLVALSLLFFFLGNRALKRSAYLILIVLVVVVSIIMTGGMGGNNRFLMNYKVQSNQIRLVQYQTAFAVFKDKPLIGVGWERFSEVSADYKRKLNLGFESFQSHAHNNYLEILASSGLFALIAFLMWIIFWGWEIYRRGDLFGKIFLGFLVSFNISGLFQCTMTDGENLFFLLGLYSISTAYYMATDNLELKKQTT